MITLHAELPYNLHSFCLIIMQLITELNNSLFSKIALTLSICILYQKNNIFANYSCEFTGASG